MDVWLAFAFGLCFGVALLLFVANVYVLWRDTLDARAALRGMGRSPMQAKGSESQCCSARSARDRCRRPSERQPRMG